MNHSISRRDMLKGTGASLAAIGISNTLGHPAIAQESSSTEAADKMQEATRAQRMQWWHAAKFGMFIHFGVYSTIGRHEWVMEDEAWPIGPYTQHAASFHPGPNCPRAWAKLAKAAGMKY